MRLPGGRSYEVVRWRKQKRIERVGLENYARFDLAALYVARKMISERYALGHSDMNVYTFSKLILK